MPKHPTEPQELHADDPRLTRDLREARLLAIKGDVVWPLIDLMESHGVSRARLAELLGALPSRVRSLLDPSDSQLDLALAAQAMAVFRLRLQVTPAALTTAHERTWLGAANPHPPTRTSFERYFVEQMRKPSYRREFYKEVREIVVEAEGASTDRDAARLAAQFPTGAGVAPRRKTRRVDGSKTTARSSRRSR